MSFAAIVVFSFLSLVLWHCSPVFVQAELSQNFSECSNFFYRGTPPQGFVGERQVKICQRYKNQYHFATLYHRGHRAPLFSAYVLKPGKGKRPNFWMYEPQLVYPRADPEMKPLPYPMTDNVKESQAVKEDYTNSIYTKGHLNPSMHQETINNRWATFTLTNIVPQQAGSNSGPWNQLEKKVLMQFKRHCVGTMHVITGVLPYKNTQHWLKNNRVLIPEYMWSAYCCPDYNKSITTDIHFPTYAAVGRNDCHSDQEIVTINNNTQGPLGYDVLRMPLGALEKILTDRLGTPISLFEEECQKPDNAK